MYYIRQDISSFSANECICPLNMPLFVPLLYRAHFREAHEAWKQYGPLSDLYVIIIDEIDAICKPRGGCPNG